MKVRLCMVNAGALRSTTSGAGTLYCPGAGVLARSSANPPRFERAAIVYLGASPTLAGSEYVLGAGTASRLRSLVRDPAAREQHDDQSHCRTHRERWGLGLVERRDLLGAVCARRGRVVWRVLLHAAGHAVLGRAVLARAPHARVNQVCGSRARRLPEERVRQACAASVCGADMHGNALAPKVKAGSCFSVGSWFTPPIVDGSA